MKSKRLDARVIRQPLGTPAGAVAEAGRELAVLGCLLLVGTIAQAQEAASSGGNQRVYSLVPRLSVSGTVTSDLHTTAGVEDAALTTQLSPGLRFTSNAGRIRGFVDYALNATGYVKTTARSEFQNSLNAAISAEAIEGLLFVDVSSNIARQGISAFGVQSVGSSSAQANRAEVFNLSVNPRISGKLAGLATYDVRASLNASNTRNSVVGDSVSSSVQFNMSGVNPNAFLTWSLNGNVQAMDYREGRRTQDKRVGGTLGINHERELLVYLIAGLESNDYVSGDASGSHTNTGLGVTWTPSERTKLSAQGQRRFFGSSHSVSFEHRMARSVWSFTDSKDIPANTGQGQGQPGSFGTNFDMFYRMYASLEPDPAKRVLFVLKLLQEGGLDPNAPAVSGFLSSAATVTRRQDLSFALSGVRDTITFSATRTESTRLDKQAQVQDDLSNSSVVRQTGLTVSYSHRLTPDSSASLTVSQQHTSGDLSSQSSTIRSIMASWTASLGPKTTVSLSPRYTVFSAVANSYKEKVIYANLIRQF